MTRCPRCGHVRTALDTQVHTGVCPSCGIAYAKWTAGREAQRTDNAPATVEDTARDEASLRQRLLVQLGTPPADLDATGWTGRAVLLGALMLWSAWFAVHGIDGEVIGGSLLHRANLAFHEFGHVFFRPFGEFMTILGGSVFQVLLPLAIAAYFVIVQRDNVAAAVGLWWCGQNLVDLSPYIRDAEYRALPLVGRGEDAHDWGNLLTMLDAVPNCYALARTSFVIGIAIMLAALAWGAWLLWQHRKTTA